MSVPAVASAPKKRGPRPKGGVACTVILAPELAEWGKAQGEGLSGLLRLLLAQEKQRREAGRVPF